MDIDIQQFEKPIPIEHIALPCGSYPQKQIDILRLDQLHETIAGNKWFKLKYNLLRAKETGATSILSFGGAYSNHLHALAYAGKLFNMKTIGIVRGEAVDNPTLQDCRNWGMELAFVSRMVYKSYREKNKHADLLKKYSGAFIIPEGGDNEFGIQGCTEILQHVKKDDYDLLCCSLGTGTTIRGLSKNFKNTIWGFSPLKNASSLKAALNNSIPTFNYIDDYHFGGFGKHPAELLDFIRWFGAEYNIELDKVYTGKMFFGIMQECAKGHLQSQRVLVIHTGGLQGNRNSNTVEL